MERLLLAAAIAGTLLLATWAHYRFWTWRFRLRGGEDETLFAATGDGWSLALARRRPRGPRRAMPVLLLHGIAANHACMDFAMGRLSLAAHLADAGFDCFALDLRGHGRSRRRPGAATRDWDFDDYLREDVPAAVEAVRSATGAARVALVGHSQGALLGMAACAAMPDRVAGLVAMAAPTRFRAGRFAALAARLAFLATGRFNRFLAGSLSPFAGWWHPPVSQVAWNANNVDGAVYRRVLVNVVENVSAGVLRQLASWIRSDTFAARDGSVDYRALLAGCRQPALFVGAVDDPLAPPAAVRAGYEAWGGEKSLWIAGKQGDCGCDYGHSDLLFGRSAPDEVFPRISGWLERQARAAPDAQ